jgi:hypothetical protein
MSDQNNDTLEDATVVPGAALTHKQISLDL